MDPINEKALLQQEARKFFTKPFNLEHAKAGAPYGCRDGKEATVLKWDRRNEEYPLVGVFDRDDTLATWNLDGRIVEADADAYDLVMLPLGYIDGKPVWWDSVLVSPGGNKFNVSEMSVSTPVADYISHCRWPAPEKVYPETLMTDHELFTVYNAVGDGKPLRRIANAALRHAIDAGQVIALDQHVKECVEAHLEGIKDGRDDMVPAAMLMRVASAVRIACEKELAEKQFSFPVLNVDLDAIIAKVQP